MSDLKDIMGFDGFGDNKKKARKFNIEEMFETARATAIGTQKNSFDQKTEEDSSDEEFGPAIPESITSPSNKVDDKMDDDDKIDEDDEIDDNDNSTDMREGIPHSHQILLKHGKKPVSALAVDPAGVRLVTGSFDYQVKFWDFAGMDMTCQSFRSVTPCDGYPIHALSFSCNGELLLVVSASAQAKILDRGGSQVLECVKGYPYILDTAATKGHTHQINGGVFSPKNKGEFITCSNDGSLRIWNIAQHGKNHDRIIKVKASTGKRTGVTACNYSLDGSSIAVGTQDGSIQLWDPKSMLVNPASWVRNAHTKNMHITSVVYSYDKFALASRSEDGKLKLWDVRKFKFPVSVVENLGNSYTMTNCGFSPSDNLIYTGCSSKDDINSPNHANFYVFDRHKNLENTLSLNVGNSSVISSLWHPRLNQVLVTTSEGQSQVYFDPKISVNGAKLCAVKPHKTKTTQIISSRQIIAPYALKIFRENRVKSTRFQEEHARKDPMKSKCPDLPVKGSGQDGRIAEKGATLAQYVIQQIAVRHDPWDKDPRGAILRHAEEAEKNPIWVDPAYKKTQPKKIFQQIDSEDKSDEPETKKNKS